MSLHDFLITNRKAILLLAEKKTVALAALRPMSDELKKGLPIFFSQLIYILDKKSSLVSVSDENAIFKASGEHGKELLRLGYTLSHVVHAYGAICQAVTEVASKMQAPITAPEFHNLNRCLDIAIAGAVTEFEIGKNTETKSREVEHLGMLAHELRNSLNRAIIASEMMAKGIVGNAGSTARVLKSSLNEMHRLLDRSLAEIKLRSKVNLHEEVFSVIDLVNHLLVTAEMEAADRNQTITAQVDTSLTLKTDRQLVLSALGNLVQNAIKYSKPKSNITVTGKAKGKNVVIAVSDKCGGIDEKKLTEMFTPFTQFNEDTSGLGLGLTIARKAISYCGGDISAKNIPDGCSIVITLPRFIEKPKTEQSVV